VEEARRNLDRHPPGDADRPRFMKDLGTALETRFEQLGDLGSLEEAIELYRQTLDLHSTGHPDRSSSLNTLANALWTRFEKLGDPDSLTSAVELHRQALHLRPTGHSDRSSSLNNLAGALWTQFGHLGDHDSLAEAIDLHRQALELCPPGHAHHSASLNNLANTMQARFEQIGDLDSLAEAVKLHRQALALRPPGHPLRSSSLNNLANAVQIWFAQNGDLDSLTEAIELLSQALELRPPGHPDRAMSLNNLASALQSRFERLGELDSLGDAIELHRQALHLQPPGHHLRSLSLNNLANALWTRFEQLKDLESLTEAVGLHRQALALRPPGHPLRSSSLHNLALTLLARYTHLDDLQSLAEAVELHRHALTLCPPGHALRPLCLSNLANTLQKRFKQLGEHGPLTEAVELHRQALDLRPPGHPDRLMSLMNLAFTLRIRSQQPDDKGENSGAQSTRLYRVSDLVQELSLYKEGLQLCANGQPLRTRLLFNTGECMLVTGAPVFDFAEGVGSILAAMQDGGCSARESLRDAIGALRVIEVAYRSLSEHPLVIGRHIQDNPILQVYKLAIRLLPRVASFGLSHDGRLRELSGAEAISRDAATRAIAAQRPTDAVEMLEESRGVFWSQALRLRTRNLDLLPSQDAQELRRLFRLLNVNTADNESTTSLQRERLVEQRRRLSTAAEALIADIRSRPGMSRFLLPPAFSSLVQALPEGFTVFLNVSELGHHALVMDGIAKSVHSLLLRLPSRLVGNTQKKSQKQKAKMRYHDGELPAVDLTQSVTEQFRAGVRDRATFGDSLAELWICIVKPIIDLLQLKVCPPSS
jgi:tetratricopeptide (TPR) repeat protein